MSDDLEAVLRRLVDASLHDRPPAPAAPPPVAYSLKDAAAAVGVSEKHLRRQIHMGLLMARMIGQKYYVSHHDLEAWFNALPEADTFMTVHPRRYGH